MTSERLTLILLARIAGEANPAAYVDSQLAPAPGAPGDIVGRIRQTDSAGNTTIFNILRDGRKVEL